jgi:hypothetical protein
VTERRSPQDRESEDRSQHDRAGDDCCNHAPGASATALNSLLLEATAALLDEKLFPILHAVRGRMNSRSNQDQPATAVWVQAMVVVQALARSAKSCASLACHVRAASLIARCAAIRSSTARRR